MSKDLMNNGFEPVPMKEFRDAIENPDNSVASVFNDVFRNTLNMMPQMKTNVTDDGKAYHVAAELPGFKKDNINLDYRHNVLTVQAKHALNKKQTNKKGRVIDHEISNRNIFRQFTLPSVDFNKISASYDGGVLKVTLPKKNNKQSDSHRIAIK